MNQKNIDEEIKLVPYSGEWEVLYKLESARIREKLNENVIDIQHIGSTSIPGIFAKPIIDIMVGIKDIKQSISIIKNLENLGYEYFGEANVPGRLYFRTRGRHHYNIAVCQFQSEIWTNNILFRDYLRANPDEAKTYGLNKKRIFEAGIDTLLKYSDLKDPMIKEIMKKAFNT